MNWRLINDIAGVKAGSEQILLIYNENQDTNACYLPVSTSNPDYVASGNAELNGSTHWCFIELP